MRALVRRDLDRASLLAGVPLSSYFVSDVSLRLWQIRNTQLLVHPEDVGWVAHAVVDVDGGFVVGHAGFHAAPDPDGLVEIGYAVDPEFRRRGYASAMVVELLRRAAREPDVRTVRAAISPDNTASLATIAGHGFVRVGEQMDRVDGLELVFEVPANHFHEPPAEGPARGAVRDG